MECSPVPVQNVGVKNDETEAVLVAADALAESQLVADIQPEQNQQHFIILTRDGTSGNELQIPVTFTPNDCSAGEAAGAVSSKFIQVEDEGGQRFVLAVSGDTSFTEIGSLKSEDSQADGAAELKLSSKKRSHSEVGFVTGVSLKKSTTQGDDVTQAWFTTRDDKAALQNRGHTWKQGQWTKEEVDLLQMNITAYCKEHGIADPTGIIFEKTKDERKDFYRTIAKGLQRPLFSVYRRVTRMYDHKNHMGKYTPEEMSRLRELRTRLGPDWAAIGAAMGRSASSVKDKCRLMKDTCNSGKWLPEEEERLAQAVYELARVKPGENVTHGLSWAQVAEHVETRSEKQCRTKWLNYLNWKQKGGTDWTRHDDINLILKMESLEVATEAEIDWATLAQDWPSVRSPQWLRGKWWSLKRHVANYQQKQFPDIIAYLKNLHLQTVRLKPVTVARVKLETDPSADLALHIPVTLQASIDGSSDDGDSLQTFEVLQHWAPNSSGAILIAQPQSDPGISFSGSAVTTDHIIVHTLQGPNKIKGTGNVTVQMNPESHVIIRTAADLGSLDSPVITSALPLPDSLGSSDQDMNDSLSNEDHLVEEEMSSSLEVQDQLPSQSEMLPNFDSQQTTSIDAHEEDFRSSSVDNNDMTMTSCSSVSSPSHFTPSNNTNSQLIHEFSDPILTSDGADLMGSSDIEGEKNHCVLSDDIQ